MSYYSLPAAVFRYSEISMRTSFLCCLTASLLCLPTALRAQGSEPGGSEPGTVVEAAPDDVRGKGDGRRGEKVEKEDGGKEENLTPEERMARNITSGASAFCRFQAALKPAKLLPGQSGTLFVTAILQGDAVLPAPPPLELMSSLQQGSVTVGGLMVRPAEVGRLAKGYLGRPVYDNYAVFELPVSLASDAQIGKRYPLVVDLKFDLYDGTSAQPIGRFLDRVMTEVEAGVVADPVVRAANRSGAVVTSKPPEAAPVVAVSAASVPTGRELRSDTVVAVDPPGVAPVTPAADSSPNLPVDDGGGDTVLVAVGGGTLLVLILLLLARRK